MFLGKLLKRQKHLTNRNTTVTHGTLTRNDFILGRLKDWSFWSPRNFTHPCHIHGKYCIRKLDGCSFRFNIYEICFNVDRKSISNTISITIINTQINCNTINILEYSTLYTCMFSSTVCYIHMLYVYIYNTSIATQYGIYWYIFLFGSLYMFIIFRHCHIPKRDKRTA